MTKRLINDIIIGTGSWGRKDQKNLMEGLKPGKATRDSDKDGMPDQWETIHGLDKTRKDPNRKMPSGYTAIEEYLNELAGKMIGNVFSPTTQPSGFADCRMDFSPCGSLIPPCHFDRTK